jgi:hypothetical protein
MIILDTTSKSIKIRLVTAGAIPWSVGWADITTTAFTLANADGYTSGTTPVEMVPPPAASTYRQVKTILVHNTLATSTNIKIMLDDGSSQYILVSALLQTMETLEFTDRGGWKALQSDGSLKSGSTTSYAQGRIDGYALDGGPDNPDGYYYLAWNRAVVSQDAYDTWVPVGFDFGVNSTWQSRFDDGYALGGPAGYISGYNQGHVAGVVDSYGYWSPLAFVEGQNASFLPRWKDGYSDGYGDPDGNPADGYFWMGKNIGYNDGYAYGIQVGTADSYGFLVPAAFQQGQNAAFLPRWKDGYSDGYGTFEPPDGYFAYGWYRGYAAGSTGGGYAEGYQDCYDAYMALPARPAWKPQGFIDGGESFILPLDDPGVHNRSTSMTVNGTAKTPSARYAACGYPCVRTSRSWHSDNDAYGGALGVAGAGTAPTPWLLSPLFGAWDGSMRYNGGQYHQCVDTTTGNISTNDPHFELVFKTPASPPSGDVVQVIAAKRSGGVGWQIHYDSGRRLCLVLQDADGYSKLLSAALSDAAWHGADIFVNRSEASGNGSQIYISGKASGSGVNFSAQELTLDAAVPLTLGADGAGNSLFSGELAYLAVRSSAAWFQEGASGPTEWATVAEERHLRMCGWWPSYAEGTYKPQAWGRTGSSWMTRCDPVTKFQRIFLVGDNWIPVEQFYLREDGYMATGGVVENSNTNRCTYSQAFDNAAWTKTRLSVVADAAMSPSGLVDGDLMREDTTANNTHDIQSATFSYSNTYAYVGSVFAKPSGRSNFQLTLYCNATASAYFNLSTGSISNLSGSCDVAGMEYWGDGWWRCFVAVRANATNTNGYLKIGLARGPNDATYSGTGGNAMFLWQAQVDAVAERATPGSIIPTTSAAASRGADTVMYFKGDDGNMGAADTAQGTVQYDAIMTPRAGTYFKFDYQMVTQGDGTYNNRVELRLNLVAGVIGQLYSYVASGGAGTARANGDHVGDTQDGRRNTIRMDFQANNTRFVFNNQKLPADTTAQAIPTIANRPRLYISADSAGARYDEGSVLLSHVKFWPSYQS